MPDSRINSWDSWFIFNLRKNKHLLSYEEFRCTYIHRKNSRGQLWFSNWLLHYNVTTELTYTSTDWCITTRMVLAVSFSLILHITWQYTYLGYLLLEAPHEYVQHGPFLSINWLRLCPQSGAVRRRLFIFLMTAGHISPNLFCLRNFLSNIHVLLPLYIHWHSYLLYITFIRTIYILFIYIIFSLFSLFLRVFMAGRLPSVHCVRYSTTSVPGPALAPTEDRQRTRPLCSCSALGCPGGAGSPSWQHLRQVGYHLVWQDRQRNQPKCSQSPLEALLPPSGSDHSFFFPQATGGGKDWSDSTMTTGSPGRSCQHRDGGNVVTDISSVNVLVETERLWSSIRLNSMSGAPLQYSPSRSRWHPLVGLAQPACSFPLFFCSTVHNV